MKEVFPLSDAAELEDVTVVQIRCADAIRSRLNDLGLLEGSRVRCLYPSVFGDPRAYLVRGAVLGIRNRDAAAILCRREALG